MTGRPIATLGDVQGALNLNGATLHMALEMPPEQWAREPICGFARQGAAGRGDIAWVRHGDEQQQASVVIARAYPNLALPHQLVALHDSPRELIAGLIRKCLPILIALDAIPSISYGRGESIDPNTKMVEGLNILPDGTPFPSIGGVRIGDDVRIDAFATVARGTLVDTEIGARTCIGAHANIGHDCLIGEDVLIVAHASLAGWVEVGNGARIYQGALIKNGVRIGAGATIGMGAVVLQDVPAGETWAGNPARRVK